MEQWEDRLGAELERLFVWFDKRSHGFRQRAAQKGVWEPARQSLLDWKADRARRWNKDKA